MRTAILRLFLFALLATLVACKPGVPDEYIQPGEMEDILYDYHIAMAMAAQNPQGNVDEQVTAYQDAVLRKYGYTQGQMRASMKYYMRHTDRLHDIYDDLAVRLNDESKELGASGTDLSMMGTSLNGDTANVWRGASALILSPVPGTNSYSFAVKVDTAFHKGDRIMLEFNSKYIIQEGSRNAYAVLAVTLGNDSIITQALRITSDSHQSVYIYDGQNNGIKDIRGYFIFPQEESMLPSTTLKLLFINGIHLIRMHATATPTVNAPSDSAPVKRPPSIPIPQGPVPVRTPK